MPSCLNESLLNSNNTHAIIFYWGLFYACGPALDCFSLYKNDSKENKGQSFPGKVGYKIVENFYPTLG